MPSFRTAILPIDRNTVLPLSYEYDFDAHCFRSLGFVRLGPVMLPEIEHSGPDTAPGRDQFLSKVLTGLAIPQKRVMQIVGKAKHDEEHETSDHRSPTGEWQLSRLSKPDFWRLTNVDTRPLRPLTLTFRGMFNGRPWKDEVMLSITVPVLDPQQSTDIHIRESDSTTQVVLRWRGKKSLFGSTREWVVDF